MSEDHQETRILVTYQSQTGNTKKVATAIFDALPEPKEVKPIREVESLEDYDLIFLGFLDQRITENSTKPNPL